MKEDQETDKAFGWVLEMSVRLYIRLFIDLLTCVELSRFCFPVHIYRYAYAVASALHGVHHNLRKDFMIQVLNNSIT
jgi:hypothetical protein